jgi:hypothetical protein
MAAVCSGVMAVGVQPQAASRPCLPRRSALGLAADELKQPGWGSSRRRRTSARDRRRPASVARALKASMPPCAAYPGRRATGDDQRQMPRRLLPGGHVRQDILDRPVVHHAGLHQRRLGHTGIRFRERGPHRLQPVEQPLHLIAHGWILTGRPTVGSSPCPGSPARPSTTSSFPERLWTPHSSATAWGPWRHPSSQQPLYTETGTTPASLQGIGFKVAGRAAIALPPGVELS